MADKVYKILIVEDEEPIRSSYEEIFKDAGFEVATAENGVKALEQLQKGTFDIMLLDLMMPEMDGIETLDRIKKQEEKFADMQIIVLTALGSDNVITKAFEHGANGYLIKTEFNPAEVIEEVKTYLE